MAYSVREVKPGDLDQLQNLYLHLNMKEKLPDTAELRQLWQEIIADPNYHIFVIELDKKIVSSCTMTVIKNLTHYMRPYALIENVVTHADYRGCGCGSAVIDRAVSCAKENNCYKVMLLTGSKNEGIARFYQEAGFNKNDKTAFVQWI